MCFAWDRRRPYGTLRMSYKSFPVWLIVVLAQEIADGLNGEMDVPMARKVGGTANYVTSSQINSSIGYGTGRSFAHHRSLR